MQKVLKLTLPGTVRASRAGTQHLDELVEKILRDISVDRDQAALLLGVDAVPDTKQLRLILRNLQPAEPYYAANGVAQADGVFLIGGGSPHLGTQARAQVGLKRGIFQAAEDF